MERENRPRQDELMRHRAETYIKQLYELQSVIDAYSSVVSQVSAEVRRLHGTPDANPQEIETLNREGAYLGYRVMGLIEAQTIMDNIRPSFRPRFSKEQQELLERFSSKGPQESPTEAHSD